MNIVDFVKHTLAKIADSGQTSGLSPRQPNAPLYLQQAPLAQRPQFQSTAPNYAAHPGGFFIQQQQRQPVAMNRITLPEPMMIDPMSTEQMRFNSLTPAQRLHELGLDKNMEQMQADWNAGSGPITPKKPGTPAYRSGPSGQIVNFGPQPSIFDHIRSMF